MSPDGRALFSESRNFTIRQFDIASGHEVRPFEGEGFTYLVDCLALNSEGSTLCVGDRLPHRKILRCHKRC